MTACQTSFNHHHKNLPDIHIDAPDNSYIKPYIDNKTLSNQKNYKIFLSDNKGDKRRKIETVQLEFPVNFQEMSFKLIADKNLIALKTPITLLSLNIDKNVAILSLKLHNNVYWLEINNHIYPMSLFLDYKETDFSISQDKKFIFLKVEQQIFKIAKQNHQNYSVKIGLMRSDLMRYVGLYIPEQTLYLKNLIIK